MDEIQASRVKGGQMPSEGSRWRTSGRGLGQVELKGRDQGGFGRPVGGLALAGHRCLAEVDAMFRPECNYADPGQHLPQRAVLVVDP